MTPTDKLPGIHALRVVAAVTVYLLHVLHLTATYVAPVTKAADNLTFGVPLFFAVSAFSLMYSTKPYEGAPGWVGKFYLKRIFRIAPLFYVMLVIDVAIVCTMTLGVFFPQKPWPGVAEVLANVTFVFGLLPQYVSSLVLVGWSVGAEMLFYFFFPLLLVSIRGLWHALAFVIFSHVIGEIARPVLDPLANIGFTATLSDLHILTNLRYFAFGILAFHIFDWLRTTRLAKIDTGAGAAVIHLVFGVVTAGMIAVLGLWQNELKALWHLEMAVWGALFTVLCVWLTIRPIRFLNWSPIQYLGERSYSLYLVHFPVLLLLTPFTAWVFEVIRPAIGDWAIAVAVIATYAPVIAISAITYRLIERPGMNFGKVLTRRIGRRPPQQQQAVAAPDAAAE